MPSHARLESRVFFITKIILLSLTGEEKAQPMKKFHCIGYLYDKRIWKENQEKINFV